MSFSKILVANRGDSDRAAGAAAQPECVVREAHAGDLDAILGNHV
jgi:hypothetical protein